MPEGLEILARRLGGIARHARESYREPGERLPIFRDEQFLWFRVAEASYDNYAFSSRLGQGK